MKLCECGCGQPTKHAAFTDKRTGVVKGQPCRFINGHGRWHQTDDTVLNRFLSKIEKVTESGCWIWMGTVSPAGYARFGWLKNDNYGHIYSYTHFIGPIQNGLHIDHLCRVRCCVNPQHLEAVTPKVNLLRGVSPIAKNAKKTHCQNGHAYDEKNTYIKPSGYRDCRACIRVREKSKRERMKNETVQ